jgi:hypothetical protein
MSCRTFVPFHSPEFVSVLEGQRFIAVRARDAVEGMSAAQRQRYLAWHATEFRLKPLVLDFYCPVCEQNFLPPIDLDELL